MVVNVQEEINTAIVEMDSVTLLSVLQNESVDIGEHLLGLARERFRLGQVSHAVFLFKLLLPAISDEKTRVQLASSFGQICHKSGCVPEARDCYLAVGLIPELIPHVAETFDELPDLVGYLGQCADYIKGLNPARLVFDKLETLVEEYLKSSEVVNERKELVDSNLQLIRKHCHPETAELLDGLSEYVTGVSVLVVNDRMLECIDGVWFIYSRSEMKHICNKSHFYLELQEVLAINCQAVFYLWGCGVGHLVDEQTFMLKGRYIVIDFRLLVSALASISLEPFFKSNFVFNFIDSRSLQISWQRMFAGASSLPPTQCVWFGPSDFQSEFQGALHSLLDHLRRSLAISEKEIRDYYQGYKFPEQGKVKALLITTKFSTYIQYAVRDIAWGFEGNGCETMILKEKDWDGVGMRDEYVQLVIATFKPDIIFCVDHLRYEFNFLIPESLPFVTWINEAIANLYDVEGNRKGLRCS